VRKSILDFPARERANESSTHTVDYLGEESVEYTYCHFYKNRAVVSKLM